MAKKVLAETFSKNVLPDVWGVPESQKRQKKVQKSLNLTKKYGFSH